MWMKMSASMRAWSYSKAEVHSNNTTPWSQSNEDTKFGHKLTWIDICQNLVFTKVKIVHWKTLMSLIVLGLVKKWSCILLWTCLVKTTEYIFIIIFHLAEYLLLNKVFAVGQSDPTACRHLPKNLKNDKDLAWGNFDYRVSNHDVVIYEWMDEKQLTWFQIFMQLTAIKLNEDKRTNPNRYLVSQNPSRTITRKWVELTRQIFTVLFMELTEKM